MDRIQQRRRLVAAAAGLIVAAGLALAGALPSQAAASTLTNATQFTTTSGAAIQAHGGGVIEVGGTYYLFGENRNSDNTFHAVSVYRSTDLVAWTFDHDVLTSSSASELNTANIERPKVLYNASTKKYVLWMHWENGVDYGEARTAVATSSTVDGDYTYLGSSRPLGNESRDMTVFQDADGTAYLISSGNGNLDLLFYRLSADYTSVAAQVANPFPNQRREAPAIVKRGSVYFLITSAQSGWDPNQATYSTATSMSGPWSSPKNLGDGITFGSQSTFILPIQGTSGTSYLYLGDRWAPAWGAPVNDSKYVWLPLTFPSSTTMSMSWTPKLSIDAGAGTVAPVSAGPGTASAYSALVGRGGGKCIDVPSSTRANGAAVTTYTCNGGANQAWQVLPKADGTVALIARHSSLCLDVKDASTADGAPLVQYTCTGAGNQSFTIRSSGGYYQLVVASSGKCLDVSGGSTGDGAAIIQYTCGSGTNQQWSFSSAG